MTTRSSGKTSSTSETKHDDRASGARTTTPAPATKGPKPCLKPIGSRILLAPERTQGFPLSRAEVKPVSERGKRAWVFLGLACFLAGMFILVEQARAHNLPGTEHNRRHAITHAFCGSLRPCPMGEKALDVAYCESGP